VHTTDNFASPDRVLSNWRDRGLAPKVGPDIQPYSRGGTLHPFLERVIFYIIIPVDGDAKSPQAFQPGRAPFQ